MMGGLIFMVNDKMCVGVMKDEMMCRIDPGVEKIALEKTGCRPMDFSGRPMKGWLLVGPEATRTARGFKEWIDFALERTKRGGKVPATGRAKRASPKK